MENHKNKDLSEFLDSDDEDIRRNEEKYKKNFNNDPSEANSFKIEEKKQSRQMKKRHLLSDSNSNDDSDEDSNPMETPNKNHNEENDSVVTQYANEIMKLFDKRDRLYDQKYKHVHNIMTDAGKYFKNESQGISSTQLKRELEGWKEKATVNEKKIRSYENDLIEAAKKNKNLLNQIEKLEGSNNNLHQTNQQMGFSKELMEIIKENQRRIEEDNKYLKEQLDQQSKYLQEKELIWSRELMTVKRKSEEAIGIQTNKSRMTENDYEGDSKTFKRNSPILHTPKRKEKENICNESNTMGRSDFITLHQPESVSSRHSNSVSF